MSEEAARSRVLVVGATGRLGGCLARASLAAGHPTFALVRPHHLARSDSPVIEPLVATGATLLQGSLEDYPSVLEAVRQVDVVICAVPTKQALEQRTLIQAIKEAGCVKRFIPAEFGLDPTKVQICDMDYGFYEKKIEIRRLIESEGIPHTYICCNFFMRYLLPSLVQPGLNAPPRDEIRIFGEGNTKGVFVKESDVAKFAICSIEDPRTLNKTVYLRPPGNVCSMNELVDLWEAKINKCLKRIYIMEEQLLKEIHGLHSRISAKHNNNNKRFTSNSNADAENDGGITHGSSSNLGQTSQFVSAPAGLSRTTTKSSYATGRHSQISTTSTLSTPFNNGRSSGESAKFSDFTGKLVGGIMKFTSNKNKAQNDTWLPCVIGKSCRI